MRALLCLPLLVLACSEPTEVTAPPGGDAPLARLSDAGEDLVIESGWARPATAGGNAAAYLVLRSDVADVLSGVTSRAFEVAELHETVSAGGRRTMQPVEFVDMPAGEAVSFAPGGLHVMLMGATDAVEEGGTVPLYLEFGSGKSVELDLPVRREAP